MKSYFHCALRIVTLVSFYDSLFFFFFYYFITIMIISYYHILMHTISDICLVMPRHFCDFLGFKHCGRSDCTCFWYSQETKCTKEPIPYSANDWNHKKRKDEFNPQRLRGTAEEQKNRKTTLWSVRYAIKQAYFIQGRRCDVWLITIKELKRRKILIIQPYSYIIQVI